MQKIVNGKTVQLTDEEIAEIEADIAANDIVLKTSTNRQKRNDLLAASDWTQANDSPLANDKKIEWATYRTALRDLPSSSDWPDVTFPTEPS